MRKVLIVAALAAGTAFLALAGYMPMTHVEAQSASTGDTQTAIFAGGCFWCVESDFDHVPGVLETISGYTGGHLENPTYRDVVSETTGHREAVKITYDPAKIDYDAMMCSGAVSIPPMRMGSSVTGERVTPRRSTHWTQNSRRKPKHPAPKSRISWARKSRP